MQLNKQKKETWYDRTLVVRASSLPMEAYKEGNMKTVESLGLEDGTYTVEVKLEAVPAVQLWKRQRS